MNKKLDEIGIPLDVIKEEFYGAKDKDKKKVFNSPFKGHSLSASVKKK